MKKICPWSNDFRCNFWTDYQISLEALKEAEELSHANWVEICSLQRRVDQLETFILNLGHKLPEKE